MKIKISATFEGKCMVCGKEGLVFSAGDEESKKIVTICQECVKEISDTPTSEVIKKYGKVSEKSFSEEGMVIKGLDKLQEELKGKIDKKEEKKNKS